MSRQFAPHSLFNMMGKSHPDSLFVMQNWKWSMKKVTPWLIFALKLDLKFVFWWTESFDTYNYEEQRRACFIMWVKRHRIGSTLAWVSMIYLKCLFQLSFMIFCFICTLSWIEQIDINLLPKNDNLQRTWTAGLIPTLRRRCVLLQRIEANPCNTSHPSLCYCNTNYIIGSSSRRLGWDCRTSRWGRDMCLVRWREESVCISATSGGFFV